MSTPDPGPRGWRRGAAAPAHTRGRPWPWTPRQRRLFVVGAGLVAVCGAILAWALIPRGFREPFFRTLSVTQYDDPGLPPNAWAEQDGALLLAHFDPEKGKDISNCQERHELLAALDEVQKTVAPKVVVHLRAHALARDGRVFLLPGNANLDRPESWLGLDEVLARLGQCQAPERLLLLDVVQPWAVSLLGPLANDVATPLDEALRREVAKEGRSLFVLCACGPGQTSQVSEELGASAFAYYLHEGLCGAADGEDPRRPPDGSVSVRELETFVTRRVGRWAALARGVAQTPRLYGDGPDFDLVSTATARPGPRALRPEVPYPADWLGKGWRLRDGWWADDLYHTEPLLLRRLEAALLRAEQRWRAGVEEDGLRDDLHTLLPAFEAAHRPARLGPAAEGSLALALAAGPDAALTAALDKLLDELEKLADETKVKAELDKVLPAAKGRPFELAAAVVEVARADPRPARLAGLAHVLAAQPDLGRFAELRWLRRLAEVCRDLRPADAARVPDGAVRLALTAIVEVERAAVFDPRARPWLAKHVQEAANLRREGFARLKGRPVPWPEALPPWTEAVDLCRKLTHAAPQLRDAFDLRDLVLATLPAVVPSLLAQPGEDTRALEAAWLDAQETLGRLDRLLAAPDLAKLEEGEALWLRLRRADLWSRFTGHGIDALLRRARRDQDAAAYRDLEGVLASPWPTGANRARLWEEARRLARRLHERVAKLDAAPGWTGPEDARAAVRPADPRKRAALHARLSAGLLELTGLPTAAPQQELAKADRSGDPAAWAEVGAKLRAAWLKQVPARFGAASPDDPAAARLSRLVPVLEGALGSRPRDPAAERHRRAAEAYRLWLDAHLRAEVP